MRARIAAIPLLFLMLSTLALVSQAAGQAKPESSTAQKPEEAKASAASDQEKEEKKEEESAADPNEALKKSTAVRWIAKHTGLKPTDL